MTYLAILCYLLKIRRQAEQHFHIITKAMLQQKCSVIIVHTEIPVMSPQSFYSRYFYNVMT